MAEQRTMTRTERAAFNLDLGEDGWAAPFVIYPSIPGELDLLPVNAAAQAWIWPGWQPHDLLAGSGEHPGQT